MDNQIRSIDEFPDELLLKILSLLLCKNVVATSVLSKRWRYLWKEVKTFRFDGETSSHRCFHRFALLLTRKSYVESLQLKLNPCFTNSDIKLLVNIAITRSLRELRFEMVYNSLEFPRSIYYVSSQLETLILEKLSLVDVPTDVTLISLKSLHLLSVRFEGDYSVERLLGICPVLEDLVVKRSSYSNVRIFTIDVPTLQSLSIVYTSVKSRTSDDVHGFVVNAPSLKCFSIRDSFSNYLQLEDMPELVKASVNVVCDQPEKFLGSLASTQYLYLCSVTSQKPSYSPSGISFLFLDHLELCSCSAEWWNLLTCILNDAPRLRVLKIKLYQKHFVQYKNMMDVWIQADSVPECLSSHLEIFEWRQYNGTEQEIEAAKYILAKASSLKKATFYSESAEKHGMLKEELESVVRGSKTCQLVFE